MSRISSCASCHGDILIPGLAQPQDQVRCPLCHAQFPVQDILPASIAAPPEAILVPRSLGSIAGAPVFRAAATTAPADLDTESIEDIAPRPPKKQPGVLSHLIGVVGGGLIGLSLGYIGLLRFGGPRYDFLEIANRLPPWVTAPINLPFLQGKGKDDGQPANDRGLKALLDQADEPPPVEMPNAPPGPSGENVAPPFDPAGAAPPFDPARAAPPPLDPTRAVSPLDPNNTLPPTEPAGAAPPFTAPPQTIPDSDFPPPTEPSPTAAQAIPPTDASAVSPMPENPTGAPPVPRTGPAHFTAYSAEDLSLATADMASALRCSACDGTGYVKASAAARDGKGIKAEPIADRRLPCTVCAGKSVTKMTPELYTRLCHLAEVVTFVSRGDTNSWTQRESVQQLMSNVGADPKSAESIGRLAGFQLEPTRHNAPGIALAGTVQEMSQVGNLYAMKVVLFGLPKVVTVVSWRPAQPAINVHDRVIILGSIVDNPAENLNGYDGRLDQVVWGGLPAKLPPQP